MDLNFELYSVNCDARRNMEEEGGVNGDDGNGNGNGKQVGEKQGQGREDLRRRGINKRKMR